jgi:integrase
VASLRTALEKQSLQNARDVYEMAFKAKGQQPPSAFEQFAQTYPPQWKFTMHDLRRTFCTVTVNIEGMPYAVVQQLMNHSQMGNVTTRYGKPTEEALRKHMQELENELLRHVSRKSGRIHGERGMRRVCPLGGCAALCQRTAEILCDYPRIGGE